MGNIDLYIQNYFLLNRSAGVTEYMYIVTKLFDPSISLALVMLCVALLIYLVKNLRYAALFSITIFAGWGAVYILKYLFDVSRPLEGVVLAMGKSFPSGHTSIATIFFIMIMHVFHSHLSLTWRRIFYTICVLGLLSVSVSRIYLGVHWFSDVLGGLVLGSLISYIAIRFFNFRKK